MNQTTVSFDHRLGAGRTAIRLHKERELWETGDSRGLKVLRNRGLVSACLRLSGLAGMADRQFLSIRVIENEVEIDRLPPSFDGYRILQLTDLHIDIDPRLIGRIIDVIAPIERDLVVLTGDYHDRIGTDRGKSMELMLELIPHLGDQSLGILGNHDVLAMVEPFEEAGLRMLLNENVRIDRGDGSIWICGVDDPYDFHTDDVVRARSNVPEAGCAILLSHSPENFGDAAKAGYSLQLSGHTHGGQICLPGGRAIIRKAKVPEPMLAGRWKAGELQGYTSRGTGSCGVAARLNCPPEVTVHILRSGR